MPPDALVPPGAALGLLETLGLVAAIEAADAMLKSSEVRLVRQARTVPGLVTHVVVGETAAVQSAVDAGAAAAERVGKVVGRHVIPRPADEVWTRLLGVTPGEPARPTATRPARPAPTADDYDDLTVRELRSLARQRDDERLQGRAIARASKDDLVAFLRTVDTE